MIKIIKAVQNSKAQTIEELQAEIKKINSDVTFEKLGKLNFAKLNGSEIIYNKGFNGWYVL